MHNSCFNIKTLIPRLNVGEKTTSYSFTLKITHFDIIPPVNTDSLTTKNTFIKPVIILKKGESLKIVLDDRQLNKLIDKTKRSCPIQAIQIILTRIKRPVFSIADFNSAYNEMPLDKTSSLIKIVSLLDDNTF